jgi:hypothetical protein
MVIRLREVVWKLLDLKTRRDRFRALNEAELALRATHFDVEDEAIDEESVEKRVDEKVEFRIGELLSRDCEVIKELAICIMDHVEREEWPRIVVEMHGEVLANVIYGKQSKNRINCLK